MKQKLITFLVPDELDASLITAVILILSKCRIVKGFNLKLRPYEAKFSDKKKKNHLKYVQAFRRKLIKFIFLFALELLFVDKSVNVDD